MSLVSRDTKARLKKAGDDVVASGPIGPVAEPPLPVANVLADLERRAVTTYTSRIQATKRLTRLNNRWNAALIAFATATTVASVGMLVDKGMYGRGGDALMVALAILSLVASLVVSGVNYGTRAKAMEANYKRVQQISCEVEQARTLEPAAQRSVFENLQREYLYAVDSSENHSEADYAKTLEEDKRAEFKGRIVRENLVVSAPLLALICPVAVVVPFVAWFINGL